MPLYALDDDNRIIAAPDAGLFCRYRCLECLSPLQKRTGLHRRAHFYHLQTVRQCRLHSNSSDHLIMQSEIQKIIPSVEIEKPFKKILRIADLCWEEKKIIFEIQCSPIDPMQTDQRTRDYAKEGYELVWLLDDRLFNRKRALRKSEILMRQKGCYYFSIQKNSVYDQFEALANKTRLVKGPPLPVDLARPMQIPASRQAMTGQLDHRAGRYFFGGDLFDRALRYPIYLERIQEMEKRILSEHQLRNEFFYTLKKGFYIGLEYLLRKHCR
jgi:competence protein CoiA